MMQRFSAAGAVICTISLTVISAGCDVESLLNGMFGLGDNEGQITGQQGQGARNQGQATEGGSGVSGGSSQDYSSGSHAQTGAQVTWSSDDHPNSPPGTGVGTSGQCVSGLIEYPGDADYFRFDAQSGRQYVIETRGSSDTIMMLFDRDGQRNLASSDDYGQDLNARIIWTAPVSGIYHVVVGLYGQGATGPYELCISNREPGPQISWLYNPDLAVSGAEPDQLVMVDFCTTWCGWCRRLAEETFTDSRVVEQAGQFICVRVDGDEREDLTTEYNITGYPTVVFLDADGREVYRVEGFCDANEFLAEMQMALQGTGDGSNSPDASDQSNVAPGQLVGIDGQCASGRIVPARDVDFFRFETQAGQRYTIETRGDSDTVMTLFDQDAQTQLAFNDDGLNLNARIIWMAPAAGVYHLKVALYDEADTGSYELCINSAPADDFPDEAPGTTISSMGQCVSARIDPAGDLDWFRFQAQSGLTYVIETLGGSDTIMGLFDQDGKTLLEFGDDYEDDLNARITWTAPASGTYHVAVGLYDGSSTGAYNLCILSSQAAR